MLQLANGFSLDLAHTLAGDLEDPADLFQRVGVAILQSIPQADDLPLPPGERLEQALDLLPQDALVGAVHGVVAGVVLDELAKARILAVTHGPIEADRMPADIEDPPHLLQWEA